MFGFSALVNAPFDRGNQRGNQIAFIEQLDGSEVLRDTRVSSLAQKDIPVDRDRFATWNAIL